MRQSVPQGGAASPDTDGKRNNDLHLQFEPRESHDDKNRLSLPGSRDSTNSYYKKVHQAQQYDQRNHNFDYQMDDHPHNDQTDQNGAKIGNETQQNVAEAAANKRSTQGSQDQRDGQSDQRPKTEEMRHEEDIPITILNDVIPEAEGEQNEYRTEDPNATHGSQNFNLGFHMTGVIPDSDRDELHSIDESLDFEDEHEDEQLDGPVLLSILNGFIQSRAQG